MWLYNWIMVFCNFGILSAHKNRPKNIFSRLFISYLCFKLYLYRNGVVITVTPFERLDVSNHQSLDCLFNSMSWLITKQTSTLSHLRCNRLLYEIAFCSSVITVTQHGRHNVSNHRSFNWFRLWLSAEQATGHPLTNETSTLSHWRRNHL